MKQLEYNKLIQTIRDLEKVVDQQNKELKEKDLDIEKVLSERAAIEEELLSLNNEFVEAINERNSRHAQIEKIWDTVPEILYVTDTDTYEVLFVNNHFEKILGEDPVGKKCYKAFQGLDAPCSFCTNDIICNNNGANYIWEHHNELLDKHFFINDQIISWPDGRNVRFEIATDITERKKAEEQLQLEIEERASIEEELRSSNEQLQEEVNDRLAVEKELRYANEKLNERDKQFTRILDSIPEVLYVVDPKTFEVVFVNKYFENLLNKNPKGEKCYKAFHNLGEPCSFCTNDIILNNAGKPYSWEHRNELLDKHFYITDQIIKWPDGRDVRFEIATDITELKKAEENLKLEIEERAAIEEELKASNEELQSEIQERAAVEEELRVTNEKLVDEMNLRKESEELQSILLNAPNETFILIKRDGTIVKINDKGAERLGLKPKDIINKSVYELIPDDLAKTRKKIIDNVFKTTHPVLFHDSRDELFFENRIYPALIKKGKVKLAAIYAIDISDRVKAEKAVVIERNFSESIIDSLPGVFYMFNKAGEFIRWNQNFLDQTGYSAEEMKKIKATDLFDGEEKQKVSERISEVFKVGYSSVEAKLITKNRKEIPYHWTGTKLVVNEEEFLIGIGDDISERVIFENALKESENRYELALEAANEGIWDWHVAEDVVYYSDQWKAQLGYKPAELEDSFAVWEELLHPDDKERAQKAVGDYLAKPEGKFLLEFRLRHKDGSYRWIHNRASSLRDKKGRVVRMFGAHTDITEMVEARQKLENSEKALRLVIDAMPFGVITVDKNRTVRSANNAAIEMMGCESEDEVLGSLCHNSLCPADKNCCPIFDFNQDIDNSERILVRKDKKDIPIIKSVVPIKLNGEEILLEAFVDVSQQKRVEQELENSEKRMRNIVNALTDAIMIVDKNGVIKEVNKAAMKLYGFLESDLVGSPTAKLIRPDYHPVFKNFFKDIDTKGMFKGETIDVKKDGTEFNTEVVGISLDYQGERHYMGIIRDVTERKKAEELLRENEQKFVSLYENAPDMFVSVSPDDGSIVECNTTLLKKLGYKREEVIGQPIFKMYHEESINKAKFVFTEFVEKGQIVNRELILKKKNGEKIDVSLNVDSVHDEDGKVLYSMSSWRDITDKKRQELELKKTLIELERSNRDLEQFAYIASHDLQEPLRMVSSFLQLLDKKYSSNLDEDGKDYIEFAVDGANRMRQLVKDLLAFSRVGTRGKPFEGVDFNELIKDSVNNLSESIKENNAKIEIKKLPKAFADKTQIVQLFQNLISNAIKFKGEDDPHIKISCVRRKEYYEFLVSDNGIGFDEKYKDRIFVIFQRLHTSEEYSGTGIGLAVCKKIVERHGGEIWVKSTSGKGSSFYFTIKR